MLFFFATAEKRKEANLNQRSQGHSGEAGLEAAADWRGASQCMESGAVTDMGAVGSGEGEEADADVGVTTEQEEVLTLVCGDDPPAVAGFASKVGVRPEGISDHEHLASLNARREALKFVLSGTLTNLTYFIDQSKSNPSCEVEGLARFHQDRLMQVQVELKAVRQEMKKIYRAKPQPLRVRRGARAVAQHSQLMNRLDPQLYSSLIFPLVACSDGEKARMLPQVCTAWRACFEQTKPLLGTLGMTRAIRDFSKLYHVLRGATSLRSLRLVCEEGATAQAPQHLCTLLAGLTALEDLQLVAPGAGLSLDCVAAVPTSITALRIEAAPALESQMASALGARLPRLTSLHVHDAVNLSDDGVVLIYVLMCVCVCMWVGVCMHVCLSVCMYACMHACMQCMYMSMHIYIYTHTHTHIHTHTYTHTHR